MSCGGVGVGVGGWRDFFSNKFVMDNMLNIILVMMVFPSAAYT